MFSFSFCSSRLQQTYRKNHGYVAKVTDYLPCILVVRKLSENLLNEPKKIPKLGIKGANLTGKCLIWDNYRDAVETLHLGLHKSNVLDTS